MQGREIAEDADQAILDLVNSSEALTQALSVHSPHFLEYLERRGRAIDALAHQHLSTTVRTSLVQALEHGQAAQEMLRHERRKIDAELAALNQKRAFIPNSRSPVRHPGLDIRG